jgi:hypothetical protein
MFNGNLLMLFAFCYICMILELGGSIFRIDKSVVKSDIILIYDFIMIIDNGYFSHDENNN